MKYIFCLCVLFSIGLLAGPEEEELEKALKGYDFEACRGLLEQVNPNEYFFETRSSPKQKYNLMCSFVSALHGLRWSDHKPALVLLLKDFLTRNPLLDINVPIYEGSQASFFNAFWVIADFEDTEVDDYRDIFQQCVNRGACLSNTRDYIEKSQDRPAKGVVLQWLEGELDRQKMELIEEIKIIHSATEKVLKIQKKISREKIKKISSFADIGEIRNANKEVGILTDTMIKKISPRMALKLKKAKSTELKAKHKKKKKASDESH